MEQLSVAGERSLHRVRVNVPRVRGTKRISAQPEAAPDVTAIATAPAGPDETNGPLDELRSPGGVG